MQSNEKKKTYYGAKRSTAIIFSIIWLLLGAMILEWLPLIPANDSSVPDTSVTLDATSFFLKTRGDSANLHMFLGEDEYILPTGQYYQVNELDLGEDVDLTDKHYVDTKNIFLRTPKITGFGTYTENFIKQILPSFKWPAEFKKTLNYIPLTLGYDIKVSNVRPAWTFNFDADYYTTSVGGKACTVVVYKDFYWVFEGVTVKEVHNFGLSTTVFEQRSSQVNVLSSDRLFCQTLEDEEPIPVADVLENDKALEGKTVCNIIVKKSVFNRLSLARSFGMLDPMSIIIAFLYILPLILLLRNVLNNHALHLEDVYESKGLAPVQKECDKLHVLKTVFTVIGVIWVGGYVVVMLLNMFMFKEPLVDLFKPALKIGATDVMVKGLAANQSILGVFTGLFFHIPTTFTDMTGYVEMLLSISSLAINAGFGLFPALLFGSMAKEADASYERFKLHSSHK